MRYAVLIPHKTPHITASYGMVTRTGFEPMLQP